MLQLLLTCVLAICGALIHMEGNKLVLHEVHILVLGMKACLVLLVSKCVGVETVASIVVHRVSLSVGLRWLKWTQEHREDITTYPGSGYRGSTYSSSSFYIRKHPNRGLQHECVRDLEGDSSLLSYGTSAVRLLPR
jgi:hypothetical protein